MWALVSPDGVAPSRMVCLSDSVNLPLHHKLQKFSSGTGSPAWSQKKGRKTVVAVWWCMSLLELCLLTVTDSTSLLSFVGRLFIVSTLFAC